MWKVKRENNNIQCSLITSPDIYIEPVPRCKIQMLMDKYPHQEWLGYLMGRVSEKENYFVEDLVIPPHKEATTASAEAKPFHKPDNCIGVIHSHHSMGAFHSAIDRDYVDKNFPISITVAKKVETLEFDAISYQRTLCGKGTTTKCTVKYVQPQPQFDTEAFMRGAVANIEEAKKVVYQPRIIGSQHIGRGDIIFPTPQGNVYIGKNGSVMTQKELDAIMQDIWD